MNSGPTRVAPGSFELDRADDGYEGSRADHVGPAVSVRRRGVGRTNATGVALMDAFASDTVYRGHIYLAAQIERAIGGKWNQGRLPAIHVTR